MSTESRAPRKPIILDCTVRDGNYAIEFQFTPRDTRLIAGHLARLGFEWIEIGHGLGLGAAAAGKTRMPGDDLDMIRAARETSGSAKVGAFFIPGLGRLDDMKAAADAGMDFVRVGYNAEEVEKALPFLEEARKLGLTPCLNMMKSYVLTPEDFAHKARRSAEGGAEVVYFVDSAGCMLPDDLATYFDAASEATNCALGFHGHDNLMMAIVNCLVAYRHGATFLDTSLCGIGRSAGNAATEVVVAAFERAGMSTGIDLFSLMDAIDEHMWPLVCHTRLHDMMGVTAGYSRFHSSFLPAVASAADRHGAELRRLVARVAQHDPSKVDEDYLEHAARDLAGTRPQHGSASLVAFDAPSLSRERISNTMSSVESLLQALTVSVSKRKDAISVMHLVPSNSPVSELVMPEFVIEDGQVVMGRVTYGTLDCLAEVVARSRDKISIFLLSHEEGGWARDVDADEVVRNEATRSKIRTINDREIKQIFLKEILVQAAETLGGQSLLLYEPSQILLDVFKSGLPFETVFLYGTNQASLRTANDGVVMLSDWRDWSDLMLRFDVVMCGANPTPADAGVLSAALNDGGRILSLAPLVAEALRERIGHSLVHVDVNKAYVGLVERLMAAEVQLQSHAA